MVHRDLKPGNVMLDDGQPVVIDFGIAHLQDSTRLTKTGLVMGTPGYLSPEIIEGKEASGASDVHSWGTTVAYAATGRQPYGTGDFQTVFYRVLAGRPELAGVPPELLPLVTAALSTDPLSRPTARSLVGLCAASGATGNAPNGSARLPYGAQSTVPDGGGATLVPMRPGIPPRPDARPSAAPAYRRADWPEYRSPGPGRAGRDRPAAAGRLRRPGAARGARAAGARRRPRPDDGHGSRHWRPRSPATA